MNAKRELEAAKLRKNGQERLLHAMRRSLGRNARKGKVQAWA
jgi:hypothetical protein